MEAETYPDPKVETLVRGSFLPIRIHIKEQPALFDRFGVKWTPTVLAMDSEGVERHRTEGFLPASEFAAQLLLGLAQIAFASGNFQEAQRRFGEILEKYPDSDAAPEALYWKGVSRYKETGDGAALGETARAFQKQYAESLWAKKASVWGPPH